MHTLFASAIPVVSLTKDSKGVTFSMSPGTMRIDVCTDAIIRVRYSLQNTIPVDNNMNFLITREWSSAGFTQTESESDVTITTSKLQIKVSKATGAVSFIDAAGKTILQETAAGGKSLTPITSGGISTYRCEQIFDSPEDEGIYGLGSMHGGFLNYHGMPEYLHQENTHISTPMFISSKGYGILWANASKTYFNLPDKKINLSNGTGQFTTTEAGDYVFLSVDGPIENKFSLTVDGKAINTLDNKWHSNSLSGKITLSANKTITVSAPGATTALYGGLLQNATKFTSRSGQTVDYYFFNGPTPDEVIANYRYATGDAPLFSKGTYGYVHCRERFSSQKEIIDTANQFRKRKIPVDMIVQDWNYWTGGWGSMQYDQTAYPNPKQMIDSLHKMHFSYMLSVWSNPQGGAVNTALANYKMSKTPFFDAFNPKARSIYWQYMNDKLFSLGVDAFWQDANEPESYDVEGTNVNFGSDPVGGITYASAYPLFVCKTVYEGWRSANTAKRVCILSRSAFPGNQRYGAISWNGDINGNWDYYTRSIRAGLNFCMSGIPYWTNDIGGFFRPSNQYTDAGYRELLTRWISFGAFMPVFRLHGYQSRTEPWLFGSSVENAFIKYDNLRYRLLPYTYSLAAKITNEGYTMMRGLVMDFWNDPNVLNIEDQFMFGPAFLVNPVTKQGATSRQLYLPAGKWYDFWSGAEVDGGDQITASAPLDQIPLYVRAGSIIPMGPELQYAAEKPTDTIELRVYPGADGTFKLYEDEGDNYNYETGKYTMIPITYYDNSQNVIIGTRQGSFTGMSSTKVFNIVYVSNNHGTGGTISSKTDFQLIYTGEQVSCKPVTSLSTTHLIPMMVPVKVTLRNIGNTVFLPGFKSGSKADIAIYNCAGRLLQKATVTTNKINLQKEYGMSNGMYIVKASIFR
jgi:alpha-D-xyloside xylohydrolase